MKNLLPLSFLAATILLAMLPSFVSRADDYSFFSYNACGTINEALTVDPTGKKEGFSAVLYNNLNGLPTSEANAIAETYLKRSRHLSYMGV